MSDINRTAVVVGWALLVLAAPGIAYIIGGLALLWLLVRHLAQQVDAGEAEPDQDVYGPPGADCDYPLCSASLRAEVAEGFWRRAAEQWRAEMSPEGDES